MLAGSLIAIFLCALQVVVAVIPGEFVEIAIGYIYGAWYGSLLCLIGITVGSIFAILIARRFGILCSGGSDFHGDNKPGQHLGSGRGDLFVPYEMYEALYKRWTEVTKNEH